MCEKIPKQQKLFRYFLREDVSLIFWDCKFRVTGEGIIFF